LEKLLTWQFLLFGLALILFIIVLRILIPFDHPLNVIIQIAGLEVTSSTGWADGWRYATGLFFTTSSAVLYCLILMLLPCVLLLSRVWHILLVPIPFVAGVLVAVLIDRWLGFVSINTSLYGLTGMLGGLGWYAITGPTKQIPTLRWTIGLVMMIVVAIGYSTMMPGLPFGLLGGFAGGFVVVAGLVSTTQNTYPHRPTRAEQLVGWLSYGLIGVAGILLLWRIATS
jgi:hypothetical protein